MLMLTSPGRRKPNKEDMRHECTKSVRYYNPRKWRGRIDTESLSTPPEPGFPYHSFLFFIQDFVHSRTAISQVELYVYFCIQSRKTEMEIIFIIIVLLISQLLKTVLLLDLLPVLLGQIDLRLSIICTKPQTNESILIYHFGLSLFLDSPVSTNNWELDSSGISISDSARFFL